MKKLRIGYVPNSENLTAPGDRRRVVFWAKNRGHEIITDLTQRVDVVILSERSDFGAFSRKTAEVPVIFDLVDGYLARENFAKDWLRGTSKVLVGQLSGTPRPFTHFVQKLCSHSAAVICSSPEQKVMIDKYSNNIHTILDSHEELPMLSFGKRKDSQKKSPSILWEGLPVTLGGVKQISQVLERAHASHNVNMNFITNTEYFRLLGKFLPTKTSNLLEKFLPEVSFESRIVPWTLENLVHAAKNSSVAVIPIPLTNPLQNMKPENRLLIMWRLGLPCLTSATPAYSRVASEAGTDTVCNSENEWETKLSTIIEDDELAEEIVTRGQTYLQENHTSEMLLDKWDRVIRSVL